MAGEYNAGIETFVSTVVVDHPRLGKVRMNTDSYNPERDGTIIEAPTIRKNRPGLPPQPLKNPRLDDEGREIAKQPSRMLLA